MKTRPPLADRVVYWLLMSMAWMDGAMAALFVGESWIALFLGQLDDAKSYASEGQLYAFAAIGLDTLAKRLGRK